MDNYIKMVKLWQKWNVQTKSDVDIRLQNFYILFAYHSGKMENSEVYYHDTREIFKERRVSGYTGNPGALFEIQNQKLCYEYIKPKLQEKEPISIKLVKNVHAVMTGGVYDEQRYIMHGERPGEFKKNDYVTTLTEVGSPPEDVVHDMIKLLDDITKFEYRGILKVGAYFHARFEHIHPFAKGNGRVGRMLLNYFLMIYNHPPLIIHEEDKHDYLRALECYDRMRDVEPMHVFLKEQIEKTWEKALAREDKRNHAMSR